MFALAARMLVALGWMIESDAGGSITVRICSDPANPGGTMTIPLEKAGSHDAGAVQQHCPWGALAHATLVPDLPWLAAAPPAIQPVPAPVPSPRFAPGLPSP